MEFVQQACITWEMSPSSLETTDLITTDLFRDWMEMIYLTLSLHLFALSSFFKSEPFFLSSLYTHFLHFPLHFQIFLSSSLFDKIFSIFWSDQIFNPTSLNFSFFIFRIFEYTLHNEVTREFSSFFFLRTLIKVKNPGQ